ncbi:hypothetical protein COW36_13840 [bacterium (Candidatus Blackallbacteria) CG17_big_fil_post_rev_8_21_14_2_50_48_46]|uniref:Uncharacterized protein n=1 Tax=bacterium (Candidatus Blackallbacteria) CG17_big_fil_post_rev_8_21_14_2_50_48_46 TaxID=2014261 RepID=A0A2M7G318_9BACT|nr:MAG: hypothetical protein COW64_23315 [bacterium (Candidatus Blackallbacteria) CG18_big_fil_WC_8_21_14_2_50_49_26]PIW16209.1 MAG: hypothetical protein COW36_13840 [bacterium (Candidatus Blackallbacteria) CG17_big_fil_post_rev_8_21_14_2_50_48_46]PIW49908.1 MAG: hypothetical protein COW20_04465 [bacterium (Candidatus Blackallbacteria) CG13_big_fil_rev_8_21_14_2_50_49_14]
MPPKNLILGWFLITVLLWGCNSPEEVKPTPSATAPAATATAGTQTSATPTASPSPAIAYSEVFRITYFSCLPCHNRKTLPQVIERVKAAHFDTVDGEDRLRVLAELEGLKDRQDKGEALGFSSGQEELMHLFGGIPGGFYIMLERGVMPPPWAPDLMQAIDWPNYERLSIENRAKLLQFAKPHSERYIP